jgi:tetratricopeptide (TPR) repeat protein
VRQKRAFQKAVCGAAAWLATCGFGCNVLEPPVVRSVDGVTSEGRFIEPDAYALYAVAALREARGQWGEALTLYQRALDIDGHGPEIKTRIAAVACKLRQNAVADRAFAAAARAAADYGPLWFELAQCKKARGELDGAQSAALEAIRLDPERYEASLLAADVAELRGDRALAWQLRDALGTHAHGSLIVQRSILAAATKSGDRVRAARARATLAGLPASADAALTQAGVPRALAALEHGDLTAAKREAARLLGADPGNGDALIIALSVADLEQDHAAFSALLEQAAEPGTPASPAVLSTLAALLSRRVSAQAAQLVRSQP